MHEPKLFLSWGLVAWPLLTKIHKRDMKICLGVKAGTLHCLIVNLCSFLHLFLHLFLRGARGVQWALRTRGGWGSSSPAPVQGDLQPSQAAPAARVGPHRQREELAANWEDGNVSITGGHTEPRWLLYVLHTDQQPAPRAEAAVTHGPKATCCQPGKGTRWTWRQTLRCQRKQNQNPLPTTPVAVSMQRTRCYWGFYFK